MPNMALQRLLLRPGQTRAVSALAATSSRPCLGLRFSSTAPVTVADTSFWKNLVPKPLRKENRAAAKSKWQKEWNPATFFIVLFLFIGSMSIQMIALRNSTERYMRQSSIRIGLLREVVERIQNGEEVDVEKVLGTGEPQKEADWEEMLQAIEQEESTRKNQKQEKPKRSQATAEQTNTVKSESQQPTPDPAPEKSKPASFGNFF